MSGKKTEFSLKNFGIAALFIGAVSVFIWTLVNFFPTEPPRDRYCVACKKGSDTDEYMKDYPKNWQRYPGARETVLLCALCKKGPAYLTHPCEKCGVVYLLDYLPKYDFNGDHVCPKCDSAFGQTAKSKGIDLMPKALNP